MRRKLYSAVLAFWACCYSYSSSAQQIVFGQTQNAAAGGMQWSMTNVLPKETGLEVNGVIYRYTAVKDPNDDMIVYVQNENAQGEGYIFRNADDWSGLPGNSINRIVPVNNIPIQFWGPGSIQVDGFGTVERPVVIYSYQYDPCFDPQARPDCPGYVDPFLVTVTEPEVDDALQDENIQRELDRKANLNGAREDEDDRQRRKLAAQMKERSRLEIALGAVNSALMTAEAMAAYDALLSLSIVPVSYTYTIPGGEIKDVPMIKDGKIPDNPNSRRLGLAQQALHDEMVEMQYTNGNQ